MLRIFLVIYYFKPQSTVKQNLKARNVYLMVCFYQREGEGGKLQVFKGTVGIFSNDPLLMPRWKYQIHSRTLETLIRSKSKKYGRFSLFQWISPLFLISINCASHFSRETINEYKQLKERELYN